MKLISSLIATLCVLGVLVWLVWQNMVPSGVFYAQWRPGDPSALIGPLVPESRLLPVRIAEDGTPYNAIVEEPINFDVRMPQAFDTATVRVTFAGEPNIVEIGGLASRESWVYDLRPAGNALLDRLTGWTTVTEGSVTLYERTPRFKSIDEFLDARPTAGVATYRATIGSSVRLRGYTPRSSARRYPVAFRGSTTIKTYLQNELLDFSFLVQDVNRHVGADTFTITASRVSSGAGALSGVDTTVANVEVADDGNSGADGKLSPTHWVRIKSNTALSGVVRIDIRAGDDIVVRETETKQQKFVFMNTFYAADAVGYASAPTLVTLVTNGRRLTATTAHPKAFQTLEVGAQQLVIDDINKRFTTAVNVAVLRKDGSVSVRAPLSDVRLQTAGVFAFDKSTFFSPDPQPLTWETDVDKDGIDYIITSYVPPKRTSPGAGQAVAWKTAEATFDLRGLSLMNRAANFTLSVPGIELQQKELRIAAIDVELRRPSVGYLEIVPALKRMWRTLTGAEKEYVNGLKN